MAKGWTQLSNVNTLVKTNTNFKGLDQLLRVTEKVSSDKLKQEGIDLFNAKKEKDEALIAAYNEKKLKSNKLIKEAQNLINERAKNNKKEKVDENQQ